MICLSIYMHIFIFMYKRNMILSINIKKCTMHVPVRNVRHEKPCDESNNELRKALTERKKTLVKLDKF